MFRLSVHIPDRYLRFRTRENFFGMYGKCKRVAEVFVLSLYMKAKLRLGVGLRDVFGRALGRMKERMRMIWTPVVVGFVMLFSVLQFHHHHSRLVVSSVVELLSGDSDCAGAADGESHPSHDSHCAYSLSYQISRAQDAKPHAALPLLCAAVLPEVEAAGSSAAAKREFRVRRSLPLVRWGGADTSVTRGPPCVFSL